MSCVSPCIPVIINIIISWYNETTKLPVPQFSTTVKLFGQYFEDTKSCSGDLEWPLRCTHLVQTKFSIPSGMLSLSRCLVVIDRWGWLWISSTAPDLESCPQHHLYSDPSTLWYYQSISWAIFLFSELPLCSQTIHFLLDDWRHPTNMSKQRQLLSLYNTKDSFCSVQLLSDAVVGDFLFWCHRMFSMFL